MKKILNFAERIYKVYYTAYLVILHIVGIGLLGYANLDFTNPIADIVLGYIGITVLFFLFDLVLLVPSLMLISAGSILNLLISISVPLFLFLSLFQALGSENIRVLNFGFIKTLTVCIFVTPIGLMNLWADYKFLDRHFW